MSNKEQIDKIFNTYYNEFKNYAISIIQNKKIKRKYIIDDIITETYQVMMKKENPIIDVGYIKRTIYYLICWNNSSLNYKPEIQKMSNDIEDFDIEDDNDILEQLNINMIKDDFIKTLDNEEKVLWHLYLNGTHNIKSLAKHFNISHKSTKTLRDLRFKQKELLRVFKDFYEYKNNN